MRRSKFIRVLGVLSVLTLGSMTTASASAFTAAPPTLVPDHPFALGCEVTPQTGTNFPGAEVEPWVDVNPANANNIVGVFQQDRWSNGGAHGLVAAASHNGGLTWKTSFAPFSRCTGGNATNGGNFERASDPWVSFSPSGTAFQVSLSFNNSNPASAVLVSRSTNGGDTWSNPITLKFDSGLRDSSFAFNDKESVTADPNNGSFAYTVWDRLVSPTETSMASITGMEHALGFRGPTWFSRTTNGGASWEPARIIFDPGEIDQTIGNVIVVRPSSKGGTLIDGFNLIFNRSNRHGERGFNVAVIRSADRGVTWSKPIVVAKLEFVQVTLPFTGQRVRTGDIIPQFAVDPRNGNLFAVWQDGRFSGLTHAAIAFSMSKDGGLSWTPPVRISKTPLGVHAFTGTVRVAADGTVGVTHYDFRNATAAAPGTTDYWMVHCHAATADCTSPANWSETHVAGPFDMTKAPSARGLFVGDYEGLTLASNNGLRPFFVMAIPGTPADRTNLFTNRVGP